MSLDNGKFRTIINNLRADHIENILLKEITLLVSREFGARRLRPVVMYGFFPDYSPSVAFRDAVEEATDNGRLDDADELRLGETDLIVRAQRNSDYSTLWFAVEASVVLNHEDITLARHSALALTRVYEQDAEALVYGYEISPENRRLAERLNVSVFLEPEGPQ